MSEYWIMLSAILFAQSQFDRESVEIREKEMFVFQILRKVPGFQSCNFKVLGQDHDNSQIRPWFINLLVFSTLSKSTICHRVRYITRAALKIILTVHQFFPDFFSGTEILTYETAKELMKRGHDVRVVTGFPSREHLEDVKRFDHYTYEGIPVERFCHGYMPMGTQTNIRELEYNNKLFVFFSKVTWFAKNRI